MMPEQTREQRTTLERLSLAHGNADCLLYRVQGTDGYTLRARFADGYAANIDQDGRAA